MSDDDTRRRWDQRYREGGTRQDPARVLTDHLYLLPARGRALDLACGLGANALVLARRGLETWAWDISQVAIARLAETARGEALIIHGQARDVAACPPPPDSFEVIVVSRFLERRLAPALQAALRPGGLLFYQTFTKLRVAAAGGPRNPEYLLDDNELLHLFSALKVRVYREEGLAGEPSQGFRNEAMLVAQRSG